MKRIIYFALFLLIISAEAFSAIDSVVVKTFSFDSLYKRRGVFKMPDNNDTYRKILMEYRLKCDPKTAHDKFNCGEWDYLTYNFVYKHTGIYDSTLSKGNFNYKLNYLPADTFKVSKTPGFAKFKEFYQKRSITKFNKDTFSFEINPGNKKINFSDTKNRFQIYYSKNELKALGLNKGQFNRFSFHALSNVDLSNLTLKMANFSNNNYNRFYNSPEAAFDTYYNDQFSVKDGWNDITLLKAFDWNGFSGILIEFCFDKDNSNFELAGIDSGYSIKASGIDKYYKFDGKNDYIYMGSIPELNGKSQFTFETWFKVDEWKNWAQLFGNTKTQIEFGDALGDLYLEVRPFVNSYAKLPGGIKVGAWYHMAFVFNGNASTNADKIKLFLNGEQQILTYTKAQLPEKTSSEDLLYSFSHLTNKNNAFKGGINETRIWNYALTENEILSRYTKEFNSKDFDKSKLIAWYAPLQNTGEYKSLNGAVNGKLDGSLVGIPTYETLPSTQLTLNQEKINFRPYLRFLKSDFESVLNNTSLDITIETEPSTLVKYKVEDYRLVPDTFEYLWSEKFNYSYNSSFAVDSLKTDSLEATGFYEFYNKKIDYYQRPVEKLDTWEIGRFITPYGINLDLGPDGFGWTYDVTDYADLLKGDVDLEVGNQQELVDVKFIFIKGTPPRNIIKRDKIWGNMQSVSYADISNDKKLQEKWMKIDPTAKQFKIKTRLTGHGHNSNTGNAPHCCEWKDNEHYLYIDNKDAAAWHIWQTFDCGTNPVFPQGGTWPHAREGWCPGDVVKDNDFEVTNLITKDSALIDYWITPVPENNLGMGGGNYVTNFELMQYSDVNYQNDMEIYDVIAPSNNQYYSRKNPICTPPVIKVRNNGAKDINSFKIIYHVSGGQVATFDWASKTGIKPHSTIAVEMPISDASFWIGDGKNQFLANIIEVNGTKDDYSANDLYISTFNMPDILGKSPVLVTKSNLRGQDFSLKVYDMKGKVVLEHPSMFSSYTYNDTLNLPDGCYTLELNDPYGYGLSYWAYKEQGNGSFKITDSKGKLLKNFNPDFGFGIKYSFYVGNYNYIEENNFESLINLSPNPIQNEVNFKSLYDLGFSEITITNLNGTVVLRDKIYANSGFEKKYNLDNYPSGLYYINLKNDIYNINKKFIKE